MELKCRYCNSKEIIKKGIRKNRRGNTQKYFCKNCYSYFIHDPGFTRMRYPKEIITKCIDLWVKGISLSKIRDHLQQFDGINVYESTILRWTRNYTRQIKEFTDSQIIQRNKKNVWHGDETVIPLKGSTIWLWQIADQKSRFLLSTHLSFDRGENHATALFTKARNIAKPPGKIMTDGLRSYKAAYQQVFDKKKTKYRGLISFRQKINNNQMAERLNCTLKDRIKPMHGLYSKETAQQFIDAYQIYYNFIKPHKSLNGITPSQVAGIELNLVGNKWLSLLKKSSENYTTIAKSNNL
jgi:transposase-like protein